MFIPKDVSDAFLPITVTNWILGVGVIEYPLGRQRVVLSGIYSKMCFFLTTICAFMYNKKFYESFGDKVNPNVKAFLSIFTYGNTFFFFIVIFMEMIYRKVGFYYISILSNYLLINLNTEVVLIYF